MTSPVAYWHVPDVEVKLGAAAEGCDALVATGVMPAGVWR